jgi:sterol desaturase/sphingolipid hydroxylase (fatty acid hydroxylase superfamily)
LFELIFDFFHYWGHRLIHSNRFLYIWVHKKHHKFRYPTTILTYYQEPLDILITNAIPVALSVWIIHQQMGWEMSPFQLTLLMIYKTYIEICGHTGKEVPNTSSFVQFMWLPRWLGIQLYTDDHDLHHTVNNCNYSKRFSLYDKLFGTFHGKFQS